ncbi:MAG: hypothetical protein JOZ02_10790 [Acidobacteria bacterium]|nr:hypothetical protein [Acidobacteriota bacterium]
MKRFVTLCCVLVTLAAGVCAQSDGARRTAPAPTLSGEPMPLNHGGKIETAYDGFAHETVVELKRMNVTCQVTNGSGGVVKGLCVTLRAALHCPGKQLDYVRQATLFVTFEAKNWDTRHPPSERQLSVVADGETMRLGRMGLVSQDVGDGWANDDMKETLELAVPFEVFQKLSRASYVEFSVGQTTFALRDKNVAALRDMNNRVKLPQAPAQAGGGN